MALVEQAALPSPGRLEPRTAGLTAPGARVTKVGAATGRTQGIVVNAAGRETVPGSGRAAPGQIVVRSLERGRPFSAEGDSGALLRDERGAAVGLLWGVNGRGDALACPIAPVLWLLGIRLAPRGAVTFDAERLA